MDVSIVIISYNTKNLLDRCLQSVFDSLTETTLTFEIIVIDNASKDGTKELLNNKYPRIIKILNKINLGFGQSNNIGIHKTNGKYILLLNSDIKVIGNAIEVLINYCKSQKNSFVGGKLLNEDHSPQPSCGPMYRLPVVFAMLFLKGDSLGLTRYSPTTIKYVDWVSGACLAGSKESFLKVGLFDEKIFMYMEEIDLLYRAKRKGYTVVFYPDATFIHTGAASSGNSKRPVVNIYQGLQYFYRKHMPPYAQVVLMMMLRWKAKVSIALSYLTGRRTTASIYEEALRIIQ